jgi:hypothetical protein
MQEIFFLIIVIIIVSWKAVEKSARLFSVDWHEW